MTTLPLGPRLAHPLALFLAAGLAGCASSALTLAPDDARTPYRPPEVASADAATSASTSPAPVVTEPASLPGDLPPGVSAAALGPDYGLAPNASIPLALARPAIDPKHVYRLPELIDIAETANPVTRAAWERARQAALATGMAEATYLPQLSVDVLAGYERSSQPAPGFQVGSPAIVTVPPGTVTAEGRQVMPTATLKWLLFDFGGRAATIEAAKSLTEAAGVSFNGTHQKLIWDVAKAFDQYTAVRAQLAIARETLANARVVHEASKARQSRGIATTIEVAQARQQVAQAELGLVQSTGAVRDVYRSLLQAMGVMPTLEIAVEDVSGRPLPRAPTGDLDRLVAASLQRRPDVQAAFARMKADKAGIERAKSDFLPRVGITGAIGKDYGSYALSDSRLPVTARHSSGSSNAGLLLGVTMPVFDGGLRDAQLKAAESRAAAAADELAQIQNDAARQIVVAWDTLRTSLAAHAAASELVAASQITAKAAVEYYRNGLGTLTDATAAQTALLQARLAKAKAHADARDAAVTIAFATGRLTNRLSPGG